MIANVDNPSGDSVGALNRFVRRHDVDVHEIDGEAVLYDLVFNTTCRLNRSAYFVWCGCDGVTGVDEIVTRMVGRFDVPVDVARRDVPTAIKAMWESGLVERVGESESA